MVPAVHAGGVSEKGKTLGAATWVAFGYGIRMGSMWDPLGSDPVLLGSASGEVANTTGF